jgi:hypothetical protein
MGVRQEPWHGSRGHSANPSLMPEKTKAKTVVAGRKTMNYVETEKKCAQTPKVRQITRSVPS